MNARVVSLKGVDPTVNYTPEIDGSAAPFVRAMPHSLEAEQHLLGSLLFDNEALQTVQANVTAASFYDYSHRVVFDCISSMAAEGVPADFVTVYDRLQRQGLADDVGGLVYLSKLSDSVTSSRNADRYAQIVAERFTERSLIAGLDEATKIAFDSATPLDARVQQLVDVVQQIQHTRLAASPQKSLLLSVGDLHAQASAVKWAVKGIIPKHGLGFVFGASGAFKSFVALDYAMHRCYGMRWLGRRTEKGIPIYLAAEGGSGLIRRIMAWHQNRGMDWKQCPLRIVVIPMTLRTQSALLRDAIKACGVEPSDIIIDTMSQTFTGNENSNDEVADWLRVIGTDLRDEFSCAVTVVHHTGHTATERPRGASAIISNIDFALGVFRDEKEMLATVEFVKVKDGERPDAAMFALTPVELGTDEDGDPITSLAAYHMASTEDVQEAMQREASAGRGGRNQLLMGLAQNGMSEKELRKAFYEDVDISAPDARKHAYYRARDWAVKQGHFEIVQGVVVFKGGKK